MAGAVLVDLRMPSSKKNTGAKKKISSKKTTGFSVPGFRFSGVSAGIKKNGGLDLGLVTSDDPKGTPLVCAAIYTTNRVKAAPVLLAQKASAKGTIGALLVNSGNANACTGREGTRAAQKTLQALAKQLQIKADTVLPASTGVIGQVLQADKVVAAIPALVKGLNPDASNDFSQAIMTTDQWEKVAFRSFSTLSTQTQTDKKPGVSVLGVAKGAGMIHPNMATTLAFVFTDAQLTAKEAQAILKNNNPFNDISVDGDTSTNDTMALLSSGKVKLTAKEKTQLRDAVHSVLLELGTSIVRDGEGARHVVTFEVRLRGPSTHADAKKIANAIGTSMLVKTAIHGRDPNWGRILAAAGRAGVDFDPDSVDLFVNNVHLVTQGKMRSQKDEQAAKKVMQEEEYSIVFSAGLTVTAGKNQKISNKNMENTAKVVTCDLGNSYIAINANYRS